MDEAEDWYRKSLILGEEVGDRPGIAGTYAQFGLLAAERGQAPLALQWNIRCPAGGLCLRGVAVRSAGHHARRHRLAAFPS